MIAISRRQPLHGDTYAARTNGNFVHQVLELDIETCEDMHAALRDHAAAFLPPAAVIVARDLSTGGLLAVILNTDGLL